MIENGLRRIPIIETHRGKKHAVGLISLDDLIENCLVSPDRLASIVASQAWRPHEKGRLPRTERQETRSAQTYSKFLKDMMSITALSREEAGKIVEVLLKVLIRRIRASEAFDFISQLPSAFHEALLNERAGPQKDVTETSFITLTSQTLGLDENRAREVIAGFWTCLKQHVSHGELEDVLGQLPKAIRKLFTAA